MFKVNSNTIFYVGCPAYYKTGGTELAHQLVYYLNKFGAKSMICYYNIKDEDKVLNPAFEQYVSDWIKLEDVVDESQNVFIVPETNTDLLLKFHQVQKSVWWMSVDNYLKNHEIKFISKYWGIYYALKRLIKQDYKPKLNVFTGNIVHFYQSEYARQFLMSRGIKTPYPLSDYINQSYLDTEVDLSSRRKDIILYNPKKGAKFTEKLISNAPDLNWKPLQNMTTEEVRQSLLESKVYIDFGNHPGKDRFPREAAICGCCIITSRNGSAKFSEDINIPDVYKFDDKTSNLEAILNKIRECLHQYNSRCTEFEDYRNKIKGEKKIFEKEVRSLLQ